MKSLFPLKVIFKLSSYIYIVIAYNMSCFDLPFRLTMFISILFWLHIFCLPWNNKRRQKGSRAACLRFFCHAWFLQMLSLIPLSMMNAYGCWVWLGRIGSRGWGWKQRSGRVAGTTVGIVRKQILSIVHNSQYDGRNGRTACGMRTTIRSADNGQCDETFVERESASD